MFKTVEHILTIVLYFPSIHFYRVFRLNQDCKPCSDLAYYANILKDVDARIFILTKHHRKADKMRVLAYAANLAQTKSNASLEEMFQLGLIEKR